MSGLPSGFHWADKIQEAAFRDTGSVNGASKVTIIETDEGPFLAVRLRPPRTWVDVQSNLIRREATRLHLCASEAKQWYIDEYNKGWQASKRVGKIERHDTTHAVDDGYLDYAAGRAKWHLTYCPDHDVCGEG
jgi:hypothetical protein